MSISSDVGKVSTAPVTAVPATAPTQAVGTLGGLPVLLATGDHVRSGPTDAGRAAASFLAQSHDVDLNWSLGSSDTRSSDGARAAAGKVVEHLMSGRHDEGTLSHMDEMLHECEHNQEIVSQEVAETMVMVSFLRTSHFIADEVEKAKETLSYLRADHMSDASQLLDDLRSADLDDTDGSDLRQEIPQATAQLQQTLNSVQYGIFKAHLGQLNEVTAGVITVSPDGVVDVEITDAPTSPQLSEQGPADFIASSGSERLSGDLTNVDGVEIANRAVADWPQMNITLNLPNGTSYNTLGNPDGLKGGVASLLELAGSRQAATVLSSVLHGGELGEIAHRFSGTNGDEVNFVPRPGSPDSADAQIRISRDADGNFRVDVNWKLASDHVERSDGREARVGLRSGSAEGDGLQLSMQGSFVIGGEQAKDGNLVIFPGASFSHHITGSLPAPGAA